MHPSLEQWNLILALLFIIGAVGQPIFEWWVNPVNEPFDWRYMWFASAPTVLGVLQGTVSTPVLSADHAAIPQLVAAISAGAGLTRVSTLAARKAGIHPRRQEDKVIKEINKEEKEEHKNDV